MEGLLPIAIIIFALICILLIIKYQDVKKFQDKLEKQKKELIARDNMRLERENELKKQFEELQNQKRVAEYSFESQQSNLQKREREIESAFWDIQEDMSVLNKMREEQLAASPWLAEMIADYLYQKDIEKADYLENKPRPARKAAEEVRKIAKEKKIIEKELLMYRYQISAYEVLFPWLEDCKELTKQDIENIRSSESDDEYETMRRWLSPTEYTSLSHIEKYQLALDRYRNSKKSKWEIGIEYEQFVGFLLEMDGYNVTYSGIMEGLKDHGRDLIAKKKDITYIIQCKRWSKDKTIHEKHIFQLYGSIVSYKLNDGRSEQTKLDKFAVSGIFVTTTLLSDFARQCAEALNIMVWERLEFDTNYPCIKCNISLRTGERIYHLPFDQQYYSTVITPSKGECYAYTVQEAEGKGFRRAKRHLFGDNGIESGQSKQMALF